MVQLRNIFTRPSSPRKPNLDHGVGIVFTPGPDNGLYVKYITPDVSSQPHLLTALASMLPHPLVLVSFLARNRPRSVRCTCHMRCAS
jgi:hypothetical protein